MQWQSTWCTDNQRWKYLSKKIGYWRVFGKTGNFKWYKQKKFTGQCVSTGGRLYFPNKMIAWLFQVIQLGLSGILVYFTIEVWTLYFVCRAFYLHHHQHPCLINYQALVSGTKREMKLLTKGGTEDAGFISQLRCILI